MTEDPLDLIEIHTGIDQAGSGRVAQRVDHELRILDLEGVFGLVPKPRAVEQCEMPEFHVGQNGCCTFGQWDDSATCSALGVLREYLDGPLDVVVIRSPEHQQLPQAHTGVDQHHHQIRQILSALLGEPPDQGGLLTMCHDPDAPAGFSERVEVRVCGRDVPAVPGAAHDRPERRHVAVGRRLGFALADQGRPGLVDVGLGDAGDRQVPDDPDDRRHPGLCALAGLRVGPGLRVHPVHGLREEHLGGLDVGSQLDPQGRFPFPGNRLIRGPQGPVDPDPANDEIAIPDAVVSLVRH